MIVKSADNEMMDLEERLSKVFEGHCKQYNMCTIKDIMARFSDKWSMYTVLILGRKCRNMRFNELKTGIKGISQRMLTVTLRSLEEDGFVTRKIFAEIPPKVEYQLTGLGKSLLKQLLELASWADDYTDDIMQARKQYGKKNN